MLLNQSNSWIPTNKYHTFHSIVNLLFLNCKACGKKGQFSHTIATKMMPKYTPHCDKGFLRQMGWQRDSLEPKILCSNWHKTCSQDRKYPASYLYSICTCLPTVIQAPLGPLTQDTSWFPPIAKIKPTAHSCLLSTDGNNWLTANT